jgi:hypothetical protein
MSISIYTKTLVLASLGCRSVSFWCQSDHNYRSDPNIYPIFTGVNAGFRSGCGVVAFFYFSSFAFSQFWIFTFRCWGDEWGMPGGTNFMVEFRIYNSSDL